MRYRDRMRRVVGTHATLCLPVALVACASAPPARAPDSSITPCVASSPVWPAPVTTLNSRLVADPSLASPTDLNPALPDGLVAAEDLGLGGYAIVAGEPRKLRLDLVPLYVAGPASKRRSLAFFFHESDAQIADAESPIRMVGADAIGGTESAARPADLYAIHALDAIIKTADDINTTVPIDFALATGDNADNAQANELGWFVNVWDGVRFKPDSGVPDTQVDEDCNDPLAEFTPIGAHFPWYAVAGNHDVLVQGNFAPERYIDEAVGSDAPMGTRDLSQPGGPVTYTAVPDAARAVMERSDLASIYLDSPSTPGPAGHGYTRANVSANTVDWSASPVPNSPIALINVDANPPDIGDAVLTVKERDTYLLPAIRAATAANKLIILTSHYALGEMAVSDGTVLGDTLMGYPNVILVVAGHTHVNSVREFGTQGDNAGHGFLHGFWEIRTSSTVDWPGEGRFIEIVDNGDRTLSILTTLLDYEAPAGSLASRARALSLIDMQSGWRGQDGSGDVVDRNTELVVRVPNGWATKAGIPGVRSDLLP